jgi:Protein of unknown function (DUF1588)/Di-haem oxidoreductase, putative peroxidase/Protein of unknown function (DUF1585)
LIEDYTTRGESKLVVTYLPVARPTDGTNFRAFKIYGDGNVFHANTGMDSDVALPAITAVTDYASEVAPYARVQSHVLGNNARTGKPLQQGDLVEFEFGVFIDKAAVRADSRTNYYSDTFRYRVGSGALTPESADSSGKLGPYASALLGGATSVAWAYAEPELYLSQMALDIQHEHVQRFVEGRRLFHTDFDSGAHSEPGNPVFSEQAHKRGPLFVASSCVSCHPNNGGGRTLIGALDQSSSMTFKLYGGSLGNQLQLAEGYARASDPESKSVLLADGTRVTLQRPHFEVKDTRSVALPSSARIARRLVGLGLLEAIDEATLLAQADPEDCDGDGISGRAQLLADPEGGAARVGRFGWRAELMCSTVPPPPPTVVATLEDAQAANDAAAIDNVRERLALHRSDPSCASCHARLDPIGLGLESFDGIGAARTTYSNGDAVDTHGELPDGTSFDGPVALSQVLAEDPRFRRCVTRKLLTYALGRGMADESALVQAVDERSAARGTVRALIETIVQVEATGKCGGFHGLQHAGDSNDGFASINWWFSTQLAALCALMDAVPEGDGTLLDHTLTMYGGAMHGGDHDARPLPMALIGGSKVGIRQNQHLDYSASADGKPLRDLYYTILNGYFGVGVAGFGASLHGSQNQMISELLS